uniref:Filamin A n=1 Tax=Cairina moschata TaxID=8855 RepID=A0A8C3CZJ3_CAIMO
MQLENVSVALEFLERENIKLVSIDSKAIVDGNLKLILGLVWTLILHYSISMPVWEDEDEEEARRQTPKQRLLGWIQNRLPQLPITNFSKDWTTGQALGALVDSCAPGLCPDWESWDPSRPIENAREAMQQADEWLGIPQVGGASAEGAGFWVGGSPPLFQAPPLYSRPPPLYSRTPPLIILIFVPPPGAGPGEVEVWVVDPSGRRDVVETTLEARGGGGGDGGGAQRCTYRPRAEGPHLVHVTFGGAPIPRSPFSVHLGALCASRPPPRGSLCLPPPGAPPRRRLCLCRLSCSFRPPLRACNPSACRAVGRGLQPKGLRVKEAADFKVYTKGAGSGELKVTVKGPSESGGGVFLALFWLIWLRFGSFLGAFGSISGAFWGSGLTPRCPPPGFSVEGPSQAKIECDDHGDGSCTVRYWPTEPGEYAVHVLCDGDDIARSPFMADVRPATRDSFPDKVKAQGPGLERSGVAVNKAAEFTVDAKNGGKGPLKDAEGNPVEVSVKDNGNGTYSCSYLPRKPIKHTAMLSWGGVNIPQSPFRMEVGAGSHPHKVKVYGPGVAKTGLKAHEPTHFTVDCSEAGQGDVSIGIKCAPGVLGPAEADVDFDIVRNPDDTFTVRYTPCGAGTYTIMVLFADQPTPSSPIRVRVDAAHDASKVKAEGPGLSRSGVELGKPTHFTVNTKAGGRAPLEVQVTGPGKGDAVRDLEVKDNHDGTHTVTYTPLQQGNLGVAVTYGGDHIPKSPFSVPVAPSVDLGKIKISGLDDKPEVGKDQEFTVKTKGAGGQGKVGAKVTGPGRKGVPCKVEPGLSPDNSLVRWIPREEGPYELEVTYDGLPVPGSPFPVEAVPPTDPSKVRAFGPGLQGGLAGVPAPFTIDTKGAGTGGLGLTVEGPCEAKLECQDNGDGTCSVSYLPAEPGDYNINILFAGSHIPGSPFRAPVRPHFDPSKVTCSGPGLEGGTAGQPGHFRVDCSRAGSAELTIGIASEAGARAEVRVEDNGDGTYTIAYTPLSPGVYTIALHYGGQPVPHFPSKVRVEPALDTAGVKVYGPGVEGKGVFREAVTEFEVDARALGKAGGGPGGLQLKARVTNPSGGTTDTFVDDRGDGTYRVEYTPYEEGPSARGFWGCYPIGVWGLGCHLIGVWELGGAGTGGLGLAVEGPSEAKMSCTDNKDGSCSVHYVPTEPGTYSLNVTYGGVPVPGSPFQVPVAPPLDPAKVKCAGPGLTAGAVRANVPQSFTVDASKAGVAELDVKVQGPKGVVEPVEVTDNGDGTRTVSYVPSREGPYSISVRYGDEEVPRSPFKVKALPTHDASKVRASGPGLNTTGVPASLPVEFTIDAKDAGEGLLDPEGKPKKASIRDNGDGTYTVSYVPDTTGRYTILIKYGGDEIPYSPYRIRAVPAGDASKCTVTVSIGGHGLGPGLGPTIQLGEQTVITVDAKAAGKGKVTCTVRTPDGSEADVDVVENADGTFDVFYTAPQPGKYVICVRFGGEHIPNSPFQVMVSAGKGWGGGATDRPLLGVNGLDMAGLRPFDLVIPFTIKKGDITGEVRMPSGKVAKPDITDNKDGTVTVRFAPTEAGLHEMDIRYDTMHIPGSPLQFYVDYVNSGHVTAYGPGLIHGTVNKPATFTVNTKDAGEGGLSLAVEGPSKAEISCTDNQDGTCSVSYLPVLPGDYSIVVKYNDKHIAGSPFTARITGDDSLRLSHLKVGASADIPLDIGESDLSQLAATVTAPSGRKEPCQLKRLRNGHLGISFVPQEVGEHLVHISRGGQPLARSPVAVTISQAELGDASRVRLTGPGLREGRTFQPSHFTIDTRDAGYGGLSLSIEGPSKVDITTEELEDGTCRVAYCPTEPGNYIIAVKFGDQHVPGAYWEHWEPLLTPPKAPFNPRSPPPPDLSPHELTALVTGPSGQTTAAQVLEGEGGGAYSIRFVPSETGGHSVSVKDHRGQHVPGSPFQFTVGPLGEGGAHKVRAGGPGLERAEAGVPAEFSIWTREAGAGGLSIAVEGPSKAEIAFEDRKDGSCGVSYVVQEPGDYEVSVKFNEEHVPDSPFVVSASSPCDAARRLTVSSLQESGLKVHQPASFAVSLNGAKGVLDAKVHSPSGALEECHISEVTEDKYAVRFIPRENGVYSIDVKFDGAHIPGSPFKVRVGEPGQAGDPGLVSAYGPAWGGAGTFEVFSVGRRSPFRARFGADFPIFTNFSSFLPIFTPAGPRLVSSHSLRESSSVLVDAGGAPVPLMAAAPPAAAVAGGAAPPGASPKFSDASKVVAKGLGLSKAFVGQKNSFTVDCSKAGNNMLLVGVQGPRAPCEELVVKHLGHQLYSVGYLLRERGDYVLVLKWGDQHVPHSPFHLSVP